MSWAFDGPLFGETVVATPMPAVGSGRTNDFGRRFVGLTDPGGTSIVSGLARRGVVNSSADDLAARACPGCVIGVRRDAGGAPPQIRYVLAECESVPIV